MWWTATFLQFIIFITPIKMYDPILDTEPNLQVFTTRNKTTKTIILHIICVILLCATQKMRDV